MEEADMAQIDEEECIDILSDCGLTVKLTVSRSLWHYLL